MILISLIDHYEQAPFAWYSAQQGPNLVQNVSDDVCFHNALDLRIPEITPALTGIKIPFTELLPLHNILTQIENTESQSFASKLLSLKFTFLFFLIITLVH
jgi:hypothetical protein